MPAPVDPPRLLGRQDELDQVLDRAAAAADGRPGLLLVTGEAGVGKSRLVAEACARLEATTFGIAVGGCVDIPGVEHVQLPFGPFMEALRRLRAAASARGEHPPLDETAAAAIDTWLRPPAAAQGSVDPVYDRFADLLTVLDGVGAHAPLVLVLEDLHWADHSSVALLVFLARNLTSERVLVIGTARTEPATGSSDTRAPFAAAIEHLMRTPGVDHLELGPLPAHAMRDLVRSLAPTPRSPQAIETILNRAEGNTLAACELAGHALDDVGSVLPRSLAASVHDRLGRAPRPARAALAAASVLGTEMAHGLLVTVLAALLPDASAADREAAIDAATGTGLLQPVGLGYRFRHGLDREAIYQDLRPGERQSLHAAAARALADSAAVAATAGPPADLAADLAAEIATHWRNSGDGVAAHRSALDAAHAATKVSAFPEALQHFEHALRMWPRPGTDDSIPDAPDCSLLMEAAEAARYAGELGRGIAFLEQAVSASCTPSEAARTWVRLAWFRREIGDGDGALTAYERAIAEIGDDRESEAAARVLSMHATALMLAGRYSAARARAAEAIEVSRAAGDGTSEINALITLGVVEASTGDPTSGLERFARAKKLLATGGGEEERWRYVANLSYVLLNLGRTEEAVEVALAAIREAATRRSFPPAGVTAVTNAATGLIDLGRWDEADALLRDGLTRHPPPGLAAHLLTCQAEIAVLRGDLATAERAIPEAIRLAASTREPDDMAVACRVRAEHLLWRGNLEATRAAVDEGLSAVAAAEDTETVLDLLTAALRAEADAACVPGLAAPGRLTRLAALLEQTVAVEGDLLPHCRLQEQLCRVELARAGGTAEAVSWQAVAEHARRLGRPHPEAYALYRQGEAELSRRRRPAATTSLRAALTITRRLGAAPLQEAVTSTARRARLSLDGDGAGGRPAPTAIPSRAAARGLTTREVEVLRMLVDGATNRLIARRLGMSEKTASVHVSRILGKLGAGNRGEAAAAAHRLRLLDDVDVQGP